MKKGGFNSIQKGASHPSSPPNVKVPFQYVYSSISYGQALHSVRVCCMGCVKTSCDSVSAFPTRRHRRLAAAGVNLGMGVDHVRYSCNLQST